VIELRDATIEIEKIVMGESAPREARILQTLSEESISLLDSTIKLAWAIVYALKSAWPV